MTIAPGELVASSWRSTHSSSPTWSQCRAAGPGNRFREVRICFDKGGVFRACGRNEEQSKLCSADRMYVPPVRLGADAVAPDRKRPTPSDELLPGPGSGGCRRGGVRPLCLIVDTPVQSFAACIHALAGSG
jgi:ribonuclease T2